MYVKEKMPNFFLDIKTNAVLEGSTAQFVPAPRGGCACGARPESGEEKEVSGEKNLKMYEFNV